MKDTVFLPGSTDQTDALMLCAQEPIQIPGLVEPHGVLFVAHGPKLQVVQLSDNCAVHFGRTPDALLGELLENIFTAASFIRLQAEIRAERTERNPVQVTDVRAEGNGARFDATLHRLDGLTYLELEPSASGSLDKRPDPFEILRNTLPRLRDASSLQELCRQAATLVRETTGFDRVMIYRFLDDNSGEVIAEERREDLEPYLGLRYPASDIPAQARRLYLVNPIRLKPAVGVAGAALVPTVNPISGKPLDMSHCILRRMSPVHEEYLTNMGVAASLSVSILKEGRLWGLIACHHCTTRYVPGSIRTACEFLADFLSARLGAREDADNREQHAHLLAKSQILELGLWSTNSLSEFFVKHSDESLSVLGAAGAALSIDGTVLLAGVTPTRIEVDALLKWLSANQHEPVFATDQLSGHHRPAFDFKAVASGLISLRITREEGHFLLWFRPEISTTVHWAGNPDKATEGTAGARLSPRHSFAVWKQTVSGKAASWTSVERQFAVSMRNAIAEATLARQNKEVERLNAELTRSNRELDAFAYASSHDLEEPIRSIRLHTEILQMNLAGKLGHEDLKVFEFIRLATSRMIELVHGLLEYSKIGGADQMRRQATNLEELVELVKRNLHSTIIEKKATITYASLPSVYVDSVQISQVIQNLLGNALKYCSEARPVIHISAETTDSYCTVHVQDNGIGFDPSYSERIFEVFKRLHGTDIPGSGIGLAICKRVIEQHGGKIWAESAHGQGAKFSFTLPIR
jgi:two-component system, chemotaxis family, sensor kinase Cph1